MSSLLQECDDNILHIILNRPEKGNAFDEQIIHTFSNALQRAENNDAIRAIIIRANGKHFSAGADLGWMQKMKNYTQEENEKDALALAELMRLLAFNTKPTIALVQGAAFGGGAGIACACDITLADKEARFCFSEVKLGLIPAVISPYVINRIGHKAKRYFLTAEIINATQAKNIGLIDEWVNHDTLLTEGQTLATLISQHAPKALSLAKKLVNDIHAKPIDEALINDTAKRIANIRVSDEGQEGLTAFFEKRKAQWNK